MRVGFEGRWVNLEWK